MIFCLSAALTQRLQLLGGAVLLAITFITPWADTHAAQPPFAVVPEPPPERSALEAKTHDIVRLARSLRGPSRRNGRFWSNRSSRRPVSGRTC